MILNRQLYTILVNRTVAMKVLFKNGTVMKKALFPPSSRSRTSTYLLSKQRALSSLLTWLLLGQIMEENDTKTV